MFKDLFGYDNANYHKHKGGIILEEKEEENQGKRIKLNWKIAVFLVIVIILAINNPGVREFSYWVETEEGLGPLERREINRYTRRTNLIVFSVYTTDLPGWRRRNFTGRAIGVANLFIPLTELYREEEDETGPGLLPDDWEEELLE